MTDFRTQQRPLIFIGHSYGGLIIKDVKKSSGPTEISKADFAQAIIRAAAEPASFGRLYTSIYSVFFFGVPHRGLETPAIERMVAREPTKELIEDLKEGSTLLRGLNERFPEAAKAIKLVTCREQLETPTTQEREGAPGEYERTGPLRMMVSETAANLFSVNEERIPIQENHSMIAKLSDEPGSEYHAVRDKMSAHADVAPAVIERRHLKTECASALSEVRPLVSFISAIVCSVKGQQMVENGIKNSFESQASFLEAFSGFLTDDELGTILEDPNLSTKYPVTIFETLDRLKILFSSYKDLMAKFYEPYFKAIQGETLFDIKYTKKTLDSASATKALREEMGQDPSINRRLFIEETLRDILKKCNRSVAELRGVMSSSMFCAMLSAGPEAWRMLQSSDGIHRMGLSRTIQLQYLTQNRTPDMESDSVALSGYLKPNTRESTDDLKLGHYFPDEDKPASDVFVEFRRYERAPRLEGSDEANKPQVLEQQKYLAKVKATMRGLAKLLQESSFEVDEPHSEINTTPRTINAFRCLGFLDDEDSCRMAFLFRLPRGVSPASVRGLKSLALYIETFDLPLKMSPLEQRFALARGLCQTVLNLHECGWIHKDIRSRNIILVPQDLITVDGPSSNEDYKFVLYLKGFEFSRPEQGKSSLKANFDPNIILYRHPERQGAPTHYFDKEHDIYAVGVVLLEIGLWRTVTSTFKSRIDRVLQGNLNMEPENIRDELLKLARKYLPMEMGTKYCQAVQKCLSGDFGILNDDKQRTNLALAFRHQVLDHIDAGSQL